MSFELLILGCSSATPAHQRNPAAQVLTFCDKTYLIDCGEATQMQMQRYKVKAHRIDHIFISHLHGDHYLGLMGLLSSMHLQGRERELVIYCQKELKEILELQFQVSGTVLRFPLRYRFFTAPTEVLLEDEQVCIKSFDLNHRVPCKGFLFKEQPRPRNLLIEKVREAGVPFDFYPELKAGKDFINSQGEVTPNAALTIDPLPSKSYAYCSDTLYTESLIPIIQGVDLLYHEATFLHDMLDRAIETYHTTCLQAGQIASNAKVKKLVIGHFSARYKDLNPLLQEAKSAFEHVYLAEEGIVYNF
jgi:ribonuclease Z